jgi:hypothetical protein
MIFVLDNQAGQLPVLFQLLQSLADFLETSY